MNWIGYVRMMNHIFVQIFGATLKNCRGEGNVSDLDIVAVLFAIQNVDAGAAKELMAYLVNMQSSLGEVNMLRIIEGVRSDVMNVADVELLMNLNTKIMWTVQSQNIRESGICLKMGHVWFSVYQELGQKVQQFVFTSNNTRKIHPRPEEILKKYLLLWLYSLMIRKMKREVPFQRQPTVDPTKKIEAANTILSRLMDGDFLERSSVSRFPLINRIGKTIPSPMLFRR